MSNTVWVITSEVDDYDQHGEYFEAVFKNKPSFDQCRKFLSEHGQLNGFNETDRVNTVNHLLNGGGRAFREHSWFNLREEVLK